MQRQTLYIGYCPHPVTVYIRGPIKGYISPYYGYYPTVSVWGQYPTYIEGYEVWASPSELFRVQLSSILFGDTMVPNIE